LRPLSNDTFQHRKKLQLSHGPIDVFVAKPEPGSTPRFHVCLGTCGIHIHGVSSDPGPGAVIKGGIVVPEEPDVEFPILPECDRQFYFSQLNYWARACISEHNHGRSLKRPHPWQSKILGYRLPYSISRLPSRVLDVGKPEHPNALCIRETGGRAVGIYIAVSHRWGETDKQFQTTTQNIQKRREEFPFQELPQTFKDAVIVARKLGVQFLWIDSLCIKQDDDLDKMTELKCMEGVFASAFCTFAATSARSCEDGFLHRSVENCVRLFDGSSNPPVSILVAKDVNNFVHDVEKAELNKRAWVLQERALSRRTIHFATAQTYWECGSAIRSETGREYDR
jgi:hypothetical protein